MFSKIIIKFLPMIVAQLTPAIKDMIKGAVAEMRKKADTTPNPYDDMIVDIIEEIMNI